MIFPRRPIEVNPLVGRIKVDPVLSRIKVDDLTVATAQEDTRINALLLNISELSHTIQQLQIATISYINFAGLLSVGALTVGLIQPERLIQIFAPYALTVVLVFLLQLYTDIERLITIREVVERHVNDILDAPAFLGINDLSRKHRGRFSVRLVAVLLGLPLILFGYHSWRTTWKPEFHWAGVNLHFLNSAGLGFCALVILGGFLEMVFARSRALREAEHTLGTIPGFPAPLAWREWIKKWVGLLSHWLGLAADTSK